MKKVRNKIAGFIPCFRIHILQVILQNTGIIASFINSQKKIQIEQGWQGKRHAKVEIYNNGQNSLLCIELKSAIVEICSPDKIWSKCNMV